MPTAKAIQALKESQLEFDDRQVGGDHYKVHRELQPFNIIDHYKMGFFDGNCLKYLLRNATTHSLQDLEKARHYLNCMIERQENG